MRFPTRAAVLVVVLFAGLAVEALSLRGLHGAVKDVQQQHKLQSDADTDSESERHHHHHHHHHHHRHEEEEEGAPHHRLVKTCNGECKPASELCATGFTTDVCNDDSSLQCCPAAPASGDATPASPPADNVETDPQNTPNPPPTSNEDSTDPAPAAATPANTAHLCIGICQENTITCPGGAYQSGKCPGAANVQCCPNPPDDTACTNAGGTCQENTEPCAPGYELGKCSGTKMCCPANVRPMVFAEDAGDNTCGSNNYPGKCQARSLECPQSNYVKGLCPGTDVCCYKSFSGTQAPGPQCTLVVLGTWHLCQYGFDAHCMVNETIGKNFIAMFNQAAADGRAMTCGSSFRTYEEQVALRRQNCGTTDDAIYDYAPGLCRPATAKPGTSNHEGGAALDLACIGDDRIFAETPCYEWMKTNSKTYGFQPYSKEAWHWSQTGT